MTMVKHFTVFKDGKAVSRAYTRKGDATAFINRRARGRVRAVYMIREHQYVFSKEIEHKVEA